MTIRPVETFGVLVVMLAVILAAMPAYKRLVKKAKSAEAAQVLKEIQERETIYFIQNGRYTDSLLELNLTRPLRYYSIRIRLSENYNYIATANANLDSDAALDRWMADGFNRIVHIYSD